MDATLLERLREVPQERYAREALKIVNKRGQLVPLEMRPAQAKLQAVLDRQRAAGLPMRAIVVKSRKTGISTWVQGVFMKRLASMPYRRSVVIAQDQGTAQALFTIGYRMWQHLPGEIKPPIAYRNTPARGSQILHLGDRTAGIVTGVDSRLQIDTAKETAAGRGETFFDMHLSECAHWPDDPRATTSKGLSVITAVPDEPDTLIVMESTANAFNWFHKRWLASMRGDTSFEGGSFEPVFIGWTEDPDCSRAFMSVEQRERFIGQIGDGPYGEAEPDLIKDFDCTPEQLYFRRTAIVDKCDGKIELFQQEYPATWEEAFIGSGRQVFSIVFTSRAIKEADRWAEKAPEDGGPQEGMFVGAEPKTRKLLDGEVLVPTKALWVPKAALTERTEWWPGYRWSARDALWTRWERPERSAEEWRLAHAAGEVSIEDMEAGIERALVLEQEGPRQVIGACDPADDIENNSPLERDEHAFNAAQFIDHRTGDQVARLQARMDHDLFARHLFLAGIFYGEGWLSVEMTGGYGILMMNLLWQRFGYRRMFERPKVESKKQDKAKDRMGWDTNPRTKPGMEATFVELLREELHGIRDPLTALQLPTYIKDDRGHHGPSAGSFSDLLMALMQAQEIRRLKPLRPRPPKDGKRPNSMTRKYRRP